MKQLVAIAVALTLAAPVFAKDNTQDPSGTTHAKSQRTATHSAKPKAKTPAAAATPSTSAAPATPAAK